MPARPGCAALHHTVLIRLCTPVIARPCERVAIPLSLGLLPFDIAKVRDFFCLQNKFVIFFAFLRKNTPTVHSERGEYIFTKNLGYITYLHARLYIYAHYVRDYSFKKNN